MLSMSVPNQQCTPQTYTMLHIDYSLRKLEEKRKLPDTTAQNTSVSSDGTQHFPFAQQDPWFVGLEVYSVWGAL